MEGCQMAACRGSHCAVAGEFYALRLWMLDAGPRQHSGIREIFVKFSQEQAIQILCRRNENRTTMCHWVISIGTVAQPLAGRRIHA